MEGASVGGAGVGRVVGASVGVYEPEPYELEPYEGRVGRLVGDTVGETLGTAVAPTSVGTAVGDTVGDTVTQYPYSLPVWAFSTV